MRETYPDTSKLHHSRLPPGSRATIAPFWGLSTSFLASSSAAGAAGAIAMINAVGNLGGFAGPFMMGWMKDQTGDYIVGLRILATAMFVGGLLANGAEAPAVD